MAYAPADTERMCGRWPFKLGRLTTAEAQNRLQKRHCRREAGSVQRRRERL